MYSLSNNLCSWLAALRQWLGVRTHLSLNMWKSKNGRKLLHIILLYNYYVHYMYIALEFLPIARLCWLRNVTASYFPFTTSSRSKGVVIRLNLGIHQTQVKFHLGRHKREGTYMCECIQMKGQLGARSLRRTRQRRINYSSNLWWLNSCFSVVLIRTI